MRSSASPRLLALGLLLPAVGIAQTSSLSPELGRRVDSVALAELSATRTPGSELAIVLGDRVIYAKGYGRANVETGQAVTPDLLFRLGSTTKMMTSLAALSLNARGLFDLDTPIGKYLPRLASPKLAAVTMRQLLTHTAGLLDYTSMSGPHDDDAMNALVPTLTDTIFFTQPGDILSYSNLGYVVAGTVLSAVTKKPYADVMHDEVFAPLGMTHSTMRPIEAMTFPLAQGHQGGRGGGAMAVIRPAPDDSRYWPAGSAFTTVLDFARLASAMMNEGRVDGKQAIPAAVIRTWLTPHVAVPGDTSRTPSRYGFGLQTRTLESGEVAVEHSGSRAGYGSMFRMLPGRKVAIIVLGNQSGISLRRTLDAATAAVAGDVSQRPVANPSRVALTASEQSAMAGSYRNSPSNGVDLVMVNGKLVARPVGSTTEGTALERIGSSLFTSGNGRFSLVTGADGKTKYLASGLRAMRKN